jgi:hypothetical protein
MVDWKFICNKYVFASFKVSLSSGEGVWQWFFAHFLLGRLSLLLPERSKLHASMWGSDAFGVQFTPSLWLLLS